MTNTQTLATVLDKLSPRDQKFALDLIYAEKRWGKLTPKQAPYVDVLIKRATQPAAEPPKETTHVGDFEKVVGFFVQAQGKLKFPKVHLKVGETVVKLSLTGSKSKVPGSIRIEGEGKFPHKPYYGNVSPTGIFTPSHKTSMEFVGDLAAVLSLLGKNPARVAKEHGKLTGHCCFCNKVLGLGKEKRSTLVGYGPDCAERWGLKAAWLAAAEKVEAENEAIKEVWFKAGEVEAPPALTPEDEALLTALEAPVEEKSALALETDAIAAELEAPVTVAEQTVGNFIGGGKNSGFIAPALQAPPPSTLSMAELLFLDPCVFCGQPAEEVIDGLAACSACAQEVAH